MRKTAKKKLAKPAKKKPPTRTPRIDPAINPDRADAAAEVLQAVWLNEKCFDLESEVVQKDGRPVVDQDAEGHLWVTVKLHVPMLDVDCWLDGTHLDHPDNQSDEDEEDA